MWQRLRFYWHATLHGVVMQTRRTPTGRNHHIVDWVCAQCGCIIGSSTMLLTPQQIKDRFVG